MSGQAHDAGVAKRKKRGTVHGAATASAAGRRARKEARSYALHKKWERLDQEAQRIESEAIYARAQAALGSKVEDVPSPADLGVRVCRVCTEDGEPFVVPDHVSRAQHRATAQHRRLMAVAA